MSRLSADLARLGTGVADELMPPVSSGHLYMGARRVGDVVEPGESENRNLPRVEERWQVVNDLDRARQLIHLRRPGAAELVLGAHGGEEATNPALLFWLARARHRSGLVAGLGPETSLEKLEAALELYDRHAALYRDPRSRDAALRLLLDRYRVSGDRGDVEELRARVGARELAGTATGLTFALRGRANEALGHRELALRDYATAIERDPADLRFRLDHRRLSEEIGGILRSGSARPLRRPVAAASAVFPRRGLRGRDRGRGIRPAAEPLRGVTHWGARRWDILGTG